ncbi:sugar transferase [Dyadobacter subterraneus]|uniref:Sugar transferase n=1 Tax=Dyadobacter subterraneus TaxID=2773304 RepID=A0ABR9WJH6_9BACT|nr:sugar transferase [Dyadobacter subterraneus]MBE9465653.1 sugar transferase [Dyadobacter subterraneus]
MYKSFGKRFFDIISVATGLIILSPLFLFLTLLLCFFNKGKPFFFQSRPGLFCKIFMIVKFKTMLDSNDPSMDQLPDQDRITRVGKFLRRTSLDEIPQLWNVLKGEMSLVGPRPLLIEYLSGYDQNQLRRHDVKPGITGWAQINGRNEISWEEKFKYDLYYVDNLSLKLDSKIFLITLIKLISRRNRTFYSNKMMEKFTGSSSLIK